jgi:hypothetical protein
VEVGLGVLGLGFLALDVGVWGLKAWAGGPTELVSVCLCLLPGPGPVPAAAVGGACRLRRRGGGRGRGGQPSAPVGAGRARRLEPFQLLQRRRLAAVGEGGAAGRRFHGAAARGPDSGLTEHMAAVASR